VNQRTWNEEPQEFVAEGRLERLCSSYADGIDRVVELERKGWAEGVTDEE